MTGTELDAVLAQMWAGFAPLARSRVDVVAAYAEQLTGGTADPARQAEAVSAAHKLAGALGSYGRDGSQDASALEQLLKSPSAPDAGLVAVHLAALRTAVAA